MELIKQTEVYRCEEKTSAENLVAEQKRLYEVKKYTIEEKNKKVKGEIVDQWWIVTIVKSFEM